MAVSGTGKKKRWKRKMRMMMVMMMMDRLVEFLAPLPALLQLIPQETDQSLPRLMRSESIQETKHITVNLPNPVHCLLHDGWFPDDSVQESGVEDCDLPIQATETPDHIYTHTHPNTQQRKVDGQDIFFCFVFLLAFLLLFLPPFLPFLSFPSLSSWSLISILVFLSSSMHRNTQTPA